MCEPFHGVLPALRHAVHRRRPRARHRRARSDRRPPRRRRRRRPRPRRQHRRIHDAHARRAAEADRDTVEAAAGRVPVVAGTGALSTRETVELSRHAERRRDGRGDDRPAVLRGARVARALAHYTAVADAIAIPTMYYNLPSASGVTLTADAAARAARRLPEGHRRRRRRGDRADPHRRPDAPQRLGHAHLRRARRRRARRRLGHRRDRAGGVRRAAPAADRRHRPAGRARAVGPAVAAVPIPRRPGFPGRGQDRVPARR